MATSKPEFQGKVLKHASSNNYCGLYKRRLINTSGAVATQYYWLPTSQIGEIVDQRGNIMNGTFASAEIASELANAPAGYGNYVDNWQNERYNSLMISYPFDTGNGGVPTYKATINDWLSKCPEINNLVLPVFWGDVFDSYAEQTANAEGSWTQINDLVTFLKSKNRKVSILLCLFLGSSEVDNFWGYDNNEKDEWNTVVSLEYGNAHPSLADKSSGSGRSMMKDFFQKVVTRYAHPDKLGAQLNWISPVITAQMEFGYNYENTVGALTAPALSGYHTKTIEGFRTWLASEVNPNRYENIMALRTKWGMYFEDFSDVTPPTTGIPFGIAQTQHFAALFKTNRGKDWWMYLSYLLVDFANELKVIVNNYAPQAKFVLSFGGNTPSDELVIMRGTYDVIKWGDVSHGIKTAFGIDTRQGKDTVAMSLDYIQNYPNKKQTELHYIDYGNKDSNGKVIDPPSVVEPRMIDSGKAAIMNGVKDLMFIAMKSHNEYYNMLKRVYDALMPYWVNPPARDTGNRSAQVTLNDLLDSGGRKGVEAWESAGGSNSLRVNFKFLNSGGGGDGGDGGGGDDLPYSMSLFPDIQTYYFRDNLSRNSYYYTTNPAIQPEYDATRVPFLVSSHGITVPLGVTKTKSHITITDQDGIVWVKMIQTKGVNQYENQVNYSNNHKELRNPPNVGEDCRFWLPIPPDGGWYDVKIDVFDAACRFEVFHADNTAPGGISYDSVKDRAYTAAETSETIRLPKSILTQQNVNHRVIKINNNRWV